MDDPTITTAIPRLRSLAALFGYETLLPPLTKRSSTTILNAARSAVQDQIDKFANVEAGVISETDLLVAGAVAAHAFPVEQSAGAANKMLPQTSAVRMFGLTCREHLDWSVARLHTDAVKANERAQKSATKASRPPRWSKHATMIDGMTPGAAARCLQAAWHASVSEEAFLAFASASGLANTRKKGFNEKKSKKIMQGLSSINGKAAAKRSSIKVASDRHQTQYLGCLPTV